MCANISLNFLESSHRIVLFLLKRFFLAKNAAYLISQLSFFKPRLRIGHFYHLSQKKKGNFIKLFLLKSDNFFHRPCVRLINRRRARTLVIGKRLFRNISNSRRRRRRRRWYHTPEGCRCAAQSSIKTSSRPISGHAIRDPIVTIAVYENIDKMIIVI